MAARAHVTGELPTWTDQLYTIRPQVDGCSCGVLALMAAEAVVTGRPLSVINPTQVSVYRRYIKARLVLNSRPYDTQADEVCDMPFCSKPSGQRIGWVQCDQCDRWCHTSCITRTRRGKQGTFLCPLCVQVEVISQTEWVSKLCHVLCCTCCF